MAQNQFCQLRVNSSGPHSTSSRATALKFLRALKFLWVWSLMLLPAASSLAATDPWKNAKIMPRNDQAWLVVGGSYVGGVRDVSWPATVARREGQWLWISDRSGYRRGALEGWINIDDVLKQTAAQDYYSLQLQTAPSGALYWLRGITWEDSGDKDVALIDYRQALTDDNTLVDAHLRLGRLEAEKGLPRAVWETHFKRASELRPHSPQVHFSWGEALRAKFSAADQAGDAQRDEKIVGKKNDSEKSAADDKHQCFCDATLKFSRAKECDPSWPYTHLGLGQLQLASAQAIMKEKLHELTKQDIDQIRLRAKSKDQLDEATRKKVEDTLASAVTEFNEAIQWNPQAVDAYRDRGEAYRLQNQLGSALRSADKACKMVDYRGSYSLQVLAAVYYDSGSADKDQEKIQSAIDYAGRATQLAQGDKGRFFKQDFDYYVEQSSPPPDTASREPGPSIIDHLRTRGKLVDTSSAGRQTSQGDAQLPARRNCSDQVGISDDAAKSAGSPAAAKPPVAGGSGSRPNSAAHGAGKRTYVIPDVTPLPLSGIQD